MYCRRKDLSILGRINELFMKTVLLITASLRLTSAAISGGILYPQDSETRQVKLLDGVWNFRVAKDSSVGFKEHWYQRDLSQTGNVIPMPVPSSYNDITEDKSIRDHVGFVWYDRTFFVPDIWRQQGYRVWLRFGSVSYSAQVFINGQKVMSHEIGHLPFHREITSVLQFGKSNRITVAVDNILSNVTVPQGALKDINTDSGTKSVQTYTFDFFNYAGIHRHVHIYTTPVIYIDDITVNTDIDGSTGYIYYNISYAGTLVQNERIKCNVRLLDHHGNEVKNLHKLEEFDGSSGRITIHNATFWWPFMMHSKPGFMYTMVAQLQAQKYNVEDVYRLPVGIRTVRWDNKQFYINGKKAYIRGLGRHEDSDIRGKGLDMALVTKDYNMIKWLGINTYRTSHYPYAEEIMDFADRQGIMIIDECPSVDTDLYSSALLQKHTESLAELIRRDKNRPSVVMWSIANEPRSSHTGAGNYFRSVVRFLKRLDSSRPVTAAINQEATKDEAAQYLDIIGFNRYNAWYQNPGMVDTIRVNVEEEATEWHRLHNKPILMTEYGADTMPGLHIEPDYIWSEEYQVKVLSEHFKAFDSLRAKHFFIGEMLWNFADFKTEQTYTRVGGNRKGVLTRQRQPKAAAHLLRKRNYQLAQIIDNYRIPAEVELDKYTVPSSLYPSNTRRIEL